MRSKLGSALKTMRRRFLSVVLLPCLLASLCFAQAPVGKQDLVYVGTFTGHGSRGIYGYRFDEGNGKLTSLGLEAETENPAFLAVDPAEKFLYAANEVAHYKDQPIGFVSAFSIDRVDGKLSLINEVSAQDPGPAFVSVDRSGKDVLIANYPLGSVAVFPILPNAGLGAASAFVRHKGSSVNPQRQAGPHAHAIVPSPDNRFALAADLGLDQILVYPFDPAKGTLGEPHIVKIALGSGPRHLLFSPSGKFVYLISEMLSTVTTFAYHATDGSMTQLQTVSTLPKDFSGKSTAGEIQIHPSGKFLYASNRGSDSIAVFAVNRNKGTLKLIEHIPTQGKTPRNFVIGPSGSWLLAANQDSNNLVTFRIGKKTGRLTPSGSAVDVPSPVCIQFVSLP